MSTFPTPLLLCVAVAISLGYGTIARGAEAPETPPRALDVRALGAGAEPIPPPQQAPRGRPRFPAGELPHAAFGTPHPAFQPAYQPLRLLGETCDYLQVEFLSQVVRHSSTHPRFMGPGEPLIGTSWRNRPLHAGWFVGGLFPDDLGTGGLRQDTSLFGGYQVGWDFDHYWGAQWRIGWSNPDLLDATDAPLGRHSRLTLTDLDLLYYPWGDTALRPYMWVGLGITSVNFYDEQGTYRDETLFSRPLGVGIKHHYRRWLSWRVELADNFALASGDVGSMHNLSLTVGIEVHFGARPGSYYPWNPSRHIW